MEFITILWFFMFFIYLVCRLDAKPFFIWPYGFYIFLFVILFYSYLRFCRFVFSLIRNALAFVRTKIKAIFSVKWNNIDNKNMNQAEPETEIETGTDCEPVEKSVDNTT